MEIVTGVIAYILIWWIMLFVILPIGIDIEKKPSLGMAWGHPKSFPLKKKLLLNTLLSIFVWTFFLFLIESHLFF